MNRQEEKYFLSQHEVSLLLRRFECISTYPVRHINSVYFDTQQFASFTDSEEGVVPRRKFRYRWYGDRQEIASSGTLETKVTNEYFRQKSSRPFSFNSSQEFAEAFRSDSPLTLNPVCQVSYQRAYFESRNGLRFTYDFDLIARSVAGWMTKKIPKTVLEIKYASDVPDAEFSSLLGDRKTRFSKYNEAVLVLGLY